MATEKVSLTLDSKVLKEARTLAGQRGLSAFVDEALSAKLQHDRIKRYLRELDEEHGPVPPDIKKQVRKEWRAAQKRLDERSRGEE